MKSRFKFILSALSLITAGLAGTNAHAGHLDYSAYFSSRLSPIGASIEGTAGYLIPIWGLAPSAPPASGAASTNNENPFWGYVRPSVTARGVATPALVGSFDFYPVTFFGFSGGRTISRQLTEQPGLDCDLAECELELNSWYWNVKLMGRYERLSGFYKFERTE